MILFATIQMKTGAVIGGLGLFLFKSCLLENRDLMDIFIERKHAVMEQDELKERLAAITGERMKWRIVKLLLRESCVAEAMELAASGRSVASFRAAWGVSGIYECDKALFLQYRDRFVSAFPRVCHHGARREYGRVMLRLLEHREYCPDRVAAEQLAETVCAWSIEPGVKLSEKVWYFSILKLLSRQVEWGGEILQQFVDMSQADSSPGMRVLLRRLSE